MNKTHKSDQRTFLSNPPFAHTSSKSHIEFQPSICPHIEQISHQTPAHFLAPGPPLASEPLLKFPNFFPPFISPRWVPSSPLFFAFLQFPNRMLSTKSSIFGSGAPHAVQADPFELTKHLMQTQESSEEGRLERLVVWMLRFISER